MKQTYAYSQLSNQDECNYLVDAEQAMKLVGNNGYYQKRMLVIFVLQWIITSAIFVGFPFLFQVPQFICDGKKCTENDESCKNIQIDPSFTLQILFIQNQFYSKLWSLLCLMFMNVTSIFSYLIVTNIADNLGKVKIANLFWFLSTIFLIVPLFIKEYYLIFLSICLAAGFANGSTNLHFAISFDQMDQKYRNYAVILVNIGWSIGGLYITFLYEKTQNWETTFYYGILTASIFLNMGYFCIVESPIFQNEISPELVQQSLKYIYQTNFNDKYQKIEVLPNYTSQGTKNKFLSIYNLVEHKNMRKLTICITATNMGMFLVYYSILQNIQFLQGSIYTINYFSFSIDILGLTIGYQFVNDMKRKPFIFILAQLYCLILILNFFIEVPKDCTECLGKKIKMFNIIMAKFLLSVSFSALSVFTSESFPQQIRSIGIGFVYGISVASTLLIPLLIDFSHSLNIDSFFIFGIISLILNCFIFGCRETFNQKLFTYIDEFNDFEKFQKINQSIIEQSQITYSKTEHSHI